MTFDAAWIYLNLYMNNMNRTSESNFKCPKCNIELLVTMGSAVNVNDGITISCNNMECKMADWGHGKNEKEAFEIFRQKCGLKEIK